MDELQEYFVQVTICVQSTSAEAATAEVHTKLAQLLGIPVDEDIIEAEFREVGGVPLLAS